MPQVLPLWRGDGEKPEAEKVSGESLRFALREYIGGVDSNCSKVWRRTCASSRELLRTFQLFDPVPVFVVRLESRISRLNVRKLVEYQFRNFGCLVCCHRPRIGSDKDLSVTLALDVVTFGIRSRGKTAISS
jgi:hypothetical protein